MHLFKIHPIVQIKVIPTENVHDDLPLVDLQYNTLTRAFPSIQTAWLGPVIRNQKRVGGPSLGTRVVP